MITIDAHSRDIVANMVKEGTPDSNSFLWMCQLRSYWDSSISDCRIKICDATFGYGYEYLGNGPRLVITPLTDRIYITATQACWLCMGTAPAGPAGELSVGQHRPVLGLGCIHTHEHTGASDSGSRSHPLGSAPVQHASHLHAGTGKTETTKDLSAQLGKSVYVFNCSPEMDYRTMGDIFKGLGEQPKELSLHRQLSQLLGRPSDIHIRALCTRPGRWRHEHIQPCSTLECLWILKCFLP